MTVQKGFQPSLSRKRDLFSPDSCPGIHICKDWTHSIAGRCNAAKKERKNIKKCNQQGMETLMHVHLWALKISKFRNIFLVSLIFPQNQQKTILL